MWGGEAELGSEPDSDRTSITTTSCIFASSERHDPFKSSPRSSGRGILRDAKASPVLFHDAGVAAMEGTSSEKKWRNTFEYNAAVTRQTTH